MSGFLHRDEVTPIPKTTRAPAEPVALPRVSTKMKSQHRKETRCKKIIRVRARGRCEACPILHDGPIRPGVDKHEIKSRARGGDPTNPENCLLVCRPCHDWIEEHDSEAILLGLSRHSWA